MSYPNLASKYVNSKLVLLAAVLALLVSATQPAQAQYTPIDPYTFAGGSDGAAPSAGLISDSKGNLYGTATNGGDISGSSCPGQNPPTGCGVVFELSPELGGSCPSGTNPGNGWCEAVLYTFTGGSDGSYPEAGLIFDSKGNLYGTASSGGDTSGSNCSLSGGCGVVFELSPPNGGGAPWNESVLYTFTGGDDGSLPYAGVIFDGNGNLYSTAVGGGLYGYGVVFELSPPSGGGVPWNESVLYPFTGGSDGQNPVAGLIFDSEGNLYGTAFGGSRGSGVVFELSPPPGGGVPWKEYVLYTFTGAKDGGSPYASLIFDSEGNLYSTTAIGGDTKGANCKRTDGCGVAFEISPPPGGGVPWNESVLYTFTGGSDGGYPEANLIFDSGSLYSTTVGGGNTTGSNCSATSGCGVVFELSPPPGGGVPWNESVLYSFNGGSDGAFPYAGVLPDSEGNFYTTTYGGGDTSGSNCSAVGGCGVVFELSPASAPVVTLSPTSLSFGNQLLDTTSAAKKVTVTNTGSATLDINSITVSGDFAISANTCGATLPVGESCKVSVTFTPAQPGKLTGTLTFVDNAPNSPQTVALSGTGIAPVTLTPSSASYGKHKVGTTSKPKTFTLTNKQTVTLTNIAISTTGDFAVSATTCGTSLAAKANCTISVTFTPTQKGTRTGQLSVSDSAAGSPQTASLTGTGD